MGTMDVSFSTTDNLFDVCTTYSLRTAYAWVLSEWAAHGESVKKITLVYMSYGSQTKYTPNNNQNSL